MALRTVLPLLLAALLVRGEESPTTPAIGAGELLAHVRMLSSDAWEGRGAGTAGERKATEYVAGLFGRLGLEPAGEKTSWFQGVSMPAGVELGKDCALACGGPGPGLALDKDWRPFAASAAAKVSGDAVFAGYGASVPGLDYDDFAGIAVSGKVVFVFRHLPHMDARWATGAVRSTHATFVAKLEQAVERGAIGLVIVNDPWNFPTAEEAAERKVRVRGDVLHRGGMGGGGEAAIPFAHITRAAAGRIFPELFGASPDELEAAIHEERGPASRGGRQRVTLHADLTRKTITGRNVCGLLRAGAPDATDEIIVVGAHHDHLGRGMAGSLARSRKERTQIHNGADDNASGTAGVLELAQFFAARRADLRRSILFMTFTGEERGLLGSRYFVGHPTVDLSKVVAMVNMDMIGRLDGKKLFVGGVKTSPVFKSILQRVNEDVGVEVVYGDGGRAPSDNTSFYDKGKPVLFFFTGMHEDYHRPSDDWDKVDAAGSEKVVRLAAGVVLELARLPETPRFQKADRGGFGPPRAVLGISVAISEDGVAIGGLGPDSPAATAGLMAGDVIVSVGGKKTPDLRALRQVMRRQAIGKTIKVTVLRDGKTIEADVTLGGG